MADTELPNQASPETLTPTAGPVPTGDPAPGGGGGPAIAEARPPMARGSGIERLKKMSTTAGLGSGDYAAVNTLSVVAIVAAVLGLVGLIIGVVPVLPALAVVAGVVALRQIRDSNGTQTGRAWALAAVLLGVGIVGYVVGGKLLHDARTKPDREQILGVIRLFDQAMAAGDYGRAYQLTTPAFQRRVTEKKWREMFAEFEAVPELGAVVGVEWNRVPPVFEEGPDGGGRMAYANVMFKYRKGADPGRLTIGFSQVDGQWRISEIQRLFGKGGSEKGGADKGGAGD